MGPWLGVPLRRLRESRAVMEGGLVSPSTSSAVAGPATSAARTGRSARAIADTLVEHISAPGDRSSSAAGRLRENVS